MKKYLFFYSTRLGFKEAKDITIEDINDEINVYKLNVLGYHTDVIGKDLVVVHNSCHENDLNCKK